MKKKQFLASIFLVSAFSCGLLSIPVKARESVNLNLKEGLTFFSDGTQIIQSKQTTLIKFDGASISDDIDIISEYLKNPAEVSKILEPSDNRFITFNRLIITREGTGISDYDGSEVTIVYSNTGKPLETYDSKGEIKKFIYDNEGKIAQVDSLIFGLETIDYNKK